MKKPKVHDVDDQDSALQDEQTNISRQMWDDYVARFQPIEQAAIADVMDDDASIARTERAGESATGAWEAGRGVTDRALSDYGVNLSEDQRELRNRMHAQNSSAGVAAVKNENRRNEEDRRMQIGDQLFQTGQRQKANALTTLNQASTMEAQRNQRNVDALNKWEQDKKARSQKIWGTVASVVVGAATGGAGLAAMGAPNAARGSG